MNMPDGAPVPPWRTVPEALRLIGRGVTFRTASRVSLLVGTVLSAVNQGSVILNGHADAATWSRVVVNFIVPYTVASVGYLAPFRIGKAGNPSTTDAMRRPGASGPAGG